MSRVYAVRVGRIPGIYMNWGDCHEQIQNFPGAKYKKFDNAIDAHDFILTGRTTPVRARDPPTSPAYRNVNANVPPVSPSTTRTTVKVAQAQASTQAPIAYATPTTSNSVSVASTSAAASGGVEKEVIIYCDGACKGNGTKHAVAGLGVWWGKDDPRNLSERCPGGQTNNRAELIAIIRVLELTQDITAPLTIKSDSVYSIKCVNEWLPKWRTKNFRKASGEPVLNQPLIVYLDALLQHRRNVLRREVKLVHVRGHMGEEGNEGADRLANLGVVMGMEEERDWVSAVGRLERMGKEGSGFEPAKPPTRQKVPLHAVNASQLVMEDFDSIDMDAFLQDPTPTPTPGGAPGQSGRYQPYPQPQRHTSRAPATPPPPSSPPAFTTPVRQFSSQPQGQMSPGEVSVASGDVDVEDYADCLDDLEVGSDGEFL